MKLRGRTALITGASRGIGKHIALAFAREGAESALVARSVQDLDAVKGEIGDLGLPCSTFVCDLLQPGAVAQLVVDIAMDFGHVDILVNNAALVSGDRPMPVIEFDDDFWEATLRLDLTVPYLLCKKLVPPMIEREYGRIINIASDAGKTGLLHGAAYSAAKHGLLGFTRTLALEVVQQGVTVNAICPGPVSTLANDKRLAYDARRLGKSPEEIKAGMTPLGRRLEPEEVAPLAVYLASDEAAVVTGQAISINGGGLVV
jgi:NAD(P)-dependent dehydrogenase (short-subunit alcohol dehydrogenase family)